MRSSLLSLIAPPACVACRRPPARGDQLCQACRLALPWLTPDRCRRCGLPRPCGDGRRGCPAAGLAFDGAWAPLAYGGPAALLLRALKERGALPVARLMAAQIVATAPEGLLGGAAVLVPVPADPLRRRLRGLDHTARLAAEIAARTGLEHRRVLRRRAARRQAGASRAERLHSAGTGVAATAPAPPVVVLVDDVHTTGATMHRCAFALRSAGARSVVAVSYARALP